ncbi:MAG TPA: ABC transporter ATP-binding protein [Candidatus Micrarchaeia archaeon]|nr:ABC transporter ATP-binding protein [Candidatus Micrarchaeia archaeon]
MSGAPASVATAGSAQDPAVAVRGLTKRYGNFTAVDGIDLVIARGEIVGLLGPNGAGKTTTLRMLSGLLHPSAGTARVAGTDIQRDPRRAKARLGYLDEEPIVYPNLTGREFLEFVCDLYGVPGGAERRDRVQRLLRLFELADKQDELIAGYSHGMRQKIGLASLLVHGPEVLLLDEPTNGLDPRSARRVKDLLQELSRRGVTTVLSTHILEIAEALCDRVAIMERGRIIAIGTLDELRRGTDQAGASLEDLFLTLTGGPESRALVDRLLGEGTAARPVGGRSGRAP